MKKKECDFMFNIAVCDDEAKVLENIADAIRLEFNKLNIQVNYFIESNPEKLLVVLENEKIDALFLDIDMPKISGMDIGEYLINNEKDTLLIFVTSYDTLVYQSFKYHPFGFIRKSHLSEEIGQVVHSVYKKLISKDDDFVFKCSNEIIKIKLDDILYFEGENNYVNLYTKTDKYRFRETLGNLEKNLSQKGFLRVHKGYLISGKEVFLVKSKEIKLSNGALIPIGRSYSEDVKKQIMRIMR